jgi:protein involved in ribonucleotide reduction
MPTLTSAPLLVYFSSVSGNTARFIEKLGLPAVASRSPLATHLEVDEPFVLVTPTYGAARGAARRRAPFPNR